MNYSDWIVSRNIPVKTNELFEQNPNQNKIYWTWLSRNPNAIPLLELNFDRINWGCLSMNPNAIPLLKQNPDKIDWVFLSSNPNAIHLLEQNPDKIDWDWLSRNPNAIHLLRQNPDKINWVCLSCNQNLLKLLTTIDYQMLKERNMVFAEELAKLVFHPHRIIKQSAAFGLSELEYLELL